MEDRLKIVISKSEILIVERALKQIDTAIGKYLIALTPKERQVIPKLGDQSLAFVSKVMDYGVSNPEFTPTYVDTEEMKRDFKVVADLQGSARKMQQLLTNIEDTMMLAGSESYVTALSYYNSVKLATKLDVPNAKTIYADLKTRFEQQNVPNSEEETPSSEEDTSMPE